LFIHINFKSTSIYNPLHEILLDNETEENIQKSIARFYLSYAILSAETEYIITHIDQEKLINKKVLYSIQRYYFFV